VVADGRARDGKGEDKYERWARISAAVNAAGHGGGGGGGGGGQKGKRECQKKWKEMKPRWSGKT
jgi:hypothetical protein